MSFHSINLGPWFRVAGIEHAHFDRLRDSMWRQTLMHPPPNRGTLPTPKPTSVPPRPGKPGDFPYRVSARFLCNSGRLDIFLRELA